LWRDFYLWGESRKERGRILLKYAIKAMIVEARREFYKLRQKNKKSKKYIK
jgi:hypothetical protein